MCSEVFQYILLYHLEKPWVVVPVFLELSPCYIQLTSADSISVLLEWLSAGWSYVPRVRIVSCGVKLCSVSTTPVLQDQIIFCKLECRLTVSYFICLLELWWASFKFNAVCVSSLILQQLNFENKWLTGYWPTKCSIRPQIDIDTAELGHYQRPNKCRVMLSLTIRFTQPNDFRIIPWHLKTKRVFVITENFLRKAVN